MASGGWESCKCVAVKLIDSITRSSRANEQRNVKQPMKGLVFAVCVSLEFVFFFTSSEITISKGRGFAARKR